MTAPGNPRVALALMKLQDGLIRALAPIVGALGRGLGACRAFLTSSRPWNLLALAIFLSGLLAGIKLLPLVYGRWSLAHEAGIAAQQSVRVGEEGVQRNLHRAAFKLGFTAAALRPETFKLDFVQEDGLDLCAISYDFIQPVNLYGLARFPFHVHARILRPPVEASPQTEDPAI